MGKGMNRGFKAQAITYEKMFDFIKNQRGEYRLNGGHVPLLFHQIGREWNGPTTSSSHEDGGEAGRPIGQRASMQPLWRARSSLGVMGCTVPPSYPNSYVEALIPSASECDSPWR